MLQVAGSNGCLARLSLARKKETHVVGCLKLDMKSGDTGYFGFNQKGQAPPRRLRVTLCLEKTVSLHLIPQRSQKPTKSPTFSFCLSHFQIEFFPPEAWSSRPTLHPPWFPVPVLGQPRVRRSFRRNSTMSDSSHHITMRYSCLE